jgi:hypothetical protein
VYSFGFFLSFPGNVDSIGGCGSGRGRRTNGGNVRRLIQIRLTSIEFGKNLANLSSQFAARTSRRFHFQKRGQLFIGVHNETLPVIAMCVNNPDCSPFKIQSCDPA